MSFYSTILQEALDVFHQHGVEDVSEQMLIKKLNVSAATFREFFEDKDDLLYQAVSHHLETEREKQQAVSVASLNAVEEIMGLLTHGVNQLKDVSPKYFPELIRNHPGVWELYIQESQGHTVQQIAGILQRGIEQELFCNNLDINLMTRLILGQINVLFDQTLFPASEYALSQVYKITYLYLIRGICTKKGVKITERFFSVSEPKAAKTEEATGTEGASVEISEAGEEQVN